MQDSLEVFPRNLGSSTCPHHPNHFGIIFDSGPDPRSKIQDVWEVFSVNLGSSTCPNHPNHFGIIFDSGPARIIRIILESFLIRAWVQDPTSKIPGRSSLGILDPVLARIIRIILESFLIRARIQDDSLKARNSEYRSPKSEGSDQYRYIC